MDSYFFKITSKTKTMGKGDRKTKRGKIIKSSYGKTRPKKKKAQKNS